MNMAHVYHIVTVRVIWTSWTHVWRLHFHFLKTWNDTAHTTGLHASPVVDRSGPSLPTSTRGRPGVATHGCLSPMLGLGRLLPVPCAPPRAAVTPLVPLIWIKSKSKEMFPFCARLDDIEKRMRGNKVIVNCFLLSGVPLLFSTNTHHDLYYFITTHRAAAYCSWSERKNATPMHSPYCVGICSHL
jgi:hypothetical protein